MSITLLRDRISMSGDSCVVASLQPEPTLCSWTVLAIVGETTNIGVVMFLIEFAVF